MALQWPTEWDQSAWGSAFSLAGFLTAIAATAFARLARNAALAQRRRIGRARLVAMLQGLDAVADGVRSAADHNSQLHAQVAMDRWPRVAGEVRGLLRNAEYDIQDQDASRILETMNGVAAKMALSKEVLDQGDVTVRQATIQLMAALDELVEKAAELRVTIEQGAEADAR